MFQNFLNKLKTKDNKSLIEAIHLGYSIIFESPEDDITATNESKRMYRKIIKNLDKITFIPTDETDVAKDTRGKTHQLYGVKFNLNQLDTNYNLNILFVNRLMGAPHHYDGNNNKMVFFIISQVEDKTDFESNLRLAKIRFKSWIEETVFTHEFTHFLDAIRYKDTYKINNKKYAEDYHNTPEEYNAFSQEIISNILKNKTRLMKLNFNDFLNKSLTYGDKDFIKNLNEESMKKLKNRLYKLYDELKTQQNLTESMNYRHSELSEKFLSQFGVSEENLSYLGSGDFGTAYSMGYIFQLLLLIYTLSGTILF